MAQRSRFFSLLRHVRPVLGSRLGVLLGIQMFATPLQALVTVGWQDNADNESGFRVERSTDGLAFAAVATVVCDTTQFADATVEAGRRYWYRIAAFNAGGDSEYSPVVSGVAPGGPNSAPTITPIDDRTVALGQAPGVFTFMIDDAETAAGDLVLSGNTSNPQLVPAANLSFGGAGAYRTLTVAPVANVTGWTTIWVKVSDRDLAAVSSFVLVIAASGAPGSPGTLMLSAFAD